MEIPIRVFTVHVLTNAVNRPSLSLICVSCRELLLLWASIHASFGNVKFVNDEGLKLYASSGIAKRIFTASKGDYYDITDGLPNTD